VPARPPFRPSFPSETGLFRRCRLQIRLQSPRLARAWGGRRVLHARSDKAYPGSYRDEGPLANCGELSGVARGLREVELQNGGEVRKYMGKKRKHLDDDLRRTLIQEAGDKCANPGCPVHRTHSEGLGAESGGIEVEHVSETIQYRTLERWY
jgi:hypothetical protein